MARGTLAKEDVAKKIAAAFGADYIGEADKKYYVYGEENGEKIQIAISMTCPKVAVEVVAPKPVVLNFEDEDGIPSKVVVPTSVEQPQITDEERNNIAAMMARLGL